MHEHTRPSSIPGCFAVPLAVHKDMRGSFVKPFSSDQLKKAGIDFHVRETLFSYSHQGVIRGMHFQEPPYEHVKIVSCSLGKALDVVLDMRKKSPTFGQSVSFQLDSEQPSIVVVPKGCAHGFLALMPNTMLTYWLDSAHMPSADKGIRWDSFSFEWPVDNPIVSERDKTLPLLDSYMSPFNA